MIKNMFKIEKLMFLLAVFVFAGLITLVTNSSVEAGAGVTEIQTTTNANRGTCSFRFTFVADYYENQGQTIWVTYRPYGGSANGWHNKGVYNSPDAYVYMNERSRGWHQYAFAIWDHANNTWDVSHWNSVYCDPGSPSECVQTGQGAVIGGCD